MSSFIHSDWKTILIFSVLAVAVGNGLLSCLMAGYYKNQPVGRLSHSQLRIKQGNASPEQRFNVFILSLLFTVTNLRLLLLAGLIAVAANFTFLLLF